MFFRRKPKRPAPVKDADGYFYAVEGEDYDSDEFETDSDCSDEDEGNAEAEIEAEHETVGVANDLGDGVGSAIDEKVASDNSTTSSGVIVDREKSKNADADGDASDSLPSPAESFEHVNYTNAHVDVKGGQLELEVEKDTKGTDLNLSLDVDVDGDFDVNNVVESELSPAPAPASEPNNEANANNVHNDNEEEGEEEPSSVQEKRSLLALAAEHDRVDVLKAILQPNINTDNTPLAQLLLNNVIVKHQNQNTDQDSNQEYQFTEEDMEDVFLPPLHFAIASSSTNATSCLLRMGSNPSIRPIIPKGWEGPNWTDENGMMVSESDWSVFHGKSAWELAFGKHPSQNGDQDHDDGVEEKRGWFSLRSPSSKQPSSNPRNEACVEIDPSKLEGIKHAFTAEALRAIGSDEVERLSELLESGLGTAERIEIGGKDLFGWCLEMNAVRCIAMVKAKYGPATAGLDTEEDAAGVEADADADADVDNEEISDADEAENEDSIADTSSDPNVSLDSTNSEENDGVVYDARTLRNLRLKLEENESLAAALSGILDNLAEEVSITQGLLMLHGDKTNIALVSQVRSLKAKRAEVEEETRLWEYKVSDRRAEFDMVMIWWKKRGGSPDDIPTLVDAASATGSDAESPRKLSRSEIKQGINQVTAQLLSSENKVKKLRASITELSEESSKNLIQVEELGLTGAVNLTRKLKDEIRERQEELNNVIQEETDLHSRVSIIRQMLESDQVGAPKKIKKDAEEIDQPSTVGMERDGPRLTAENTNEDGEENTILNVVPEDPVLREVTDVDQIYDCSESIESDIEGDSYSYNSSDDSEDDDDSDSYDSYEDLPHSENIKRGHSTALVPWDDDGDLGFFAFKVWDLFQRIFGLSKSAIQQTAKSTVDDVVNIPRVMII